MDKKTPVIEVDEVSLEDLIILGDEKLINIKISYPKEEEGIIRTVTSKAKIKQLTMKELKNVDMNNITITTAINILCKALFKQDETLFSKEMIDVLPVGVCFAITREIMRISGVDETQLGF